MEHKALMREAEFVIHCDKHNWKYAWFGEHHALTEYSHMSAPEAVMGYCAARTDYIHMSSGINSPPPRKDRPELAAKRAAMLDLITEGICEWVTARGAGSPEMKGFNVRDAALS